MSERIPQSFIDELLTRVDITQIIDQHVPLKKKGNNYSALCPFHSEKSPSFSVSGPKQFYYCFGCGASGNAIGFLMNYLHLSFVESIETLANQAGLEIPREAGSSNRPSLTPLYELMEKAASFYEKQLPKAQAAQAYLLEKRGLSQETIQHFRIGYAPSGWDNLLKAAGKQQLEELCTTGMLIKKNDHDAYDRFRDRVMFPIRDRRGRVVAFGGRVMGDDTPKYLNSPETPIFHKSQELYGLYETLQKHRKIEQLVVVEGYMDVVALAQSGVDYAVATLGTAITAQHMQRLFRTCNNITFCLDGDKAGRGAAWRAVETVLPLLQEEWQMRFMFLPEGEDPDSLIRKEGKETFEKRLARAHSLSAFLLRYLSHQSDMSKLDGRARFAKQAMEYVKKIPAPIMQSMLTEAIAKTAGIDLMTLQKILSSEGTGDDTYVKPPTEKPAGKNSALRKAITLLIQNPELAEHCSQPLPKLEQNGWQLLCDLLELLKQSPKLPTGAILEHWRDKPELKILTQLASAQHIVPEGGLVAEFQDILKRLRQQGIEQHIERLLGKVRQNTITDDEKSQLQQLLREK